jgi:hypothetical protein
LLARELEKSLVESSANSEMPSQGAAAQQSQSAPTKGDSAQVSRAFLPAERCQPMLALITIIRQLSRLLPSVWNSSNEHECTDIEEGNLRLDHLAQFLEPCGSP